MPCQTANIVQECYEFSCDYKEYKVLTWHPNSADFNPIEHMWDLLDKQFWSMEAPTHNLQGLKDMLLSSLCQILQTHLDGWHKKDLHSIWQVVLILWLIGD